MDSSGSLAKMSDTGQPPGAGPPTNPQSKTSMTPVETGDGPKQPRRMRTFEEIVSEEKKEQKHPYHQVN